jgi:hypothetical protein
VSGGSVPALNETKCGDGFANRADFVSREPGYVGGFRAGGRGGAETRDGSTRVQTDVRTAFASFNAV